MSNNVKCIGFAGKIRGHKFMLKMGSWTSSYITWQPTDYCVRCGMPVGGWLPTFRDEGYGNRKLSLPKVPYSDNVTS